MTVKSFHHRAVPLTGHWAETHVHVVLYMCFAINYWWISLFVFVDLFVSESITIPPPPPGAQAVKIRRICNDACYVTQLDIQNRLLIVKTLDTGIIWIFFQSTNRFIIWSAVYCSMITKVVPIQIQVSELPQVLPKILESLSARTRVGALI